MAQETFTDNVLIDGSQDIEQLRVQGHTTQTEPLQTWENSAGESLAQVTGDGRLIVGEHDSTPNSLIEAHQLDGSPTKPNRGIHSLGQVDNVDEPVEWTVNELELTGSSNVDALHTALRVRATNLNTGTPTGSAELRGVDVEVANMGSGNVEPLTKVTGLQISVTNADNHEITEAIGLKVKITDEEENGITNAFSIYTEGPGPIHLEDYVDLKVHAEAPDAPVSDFFRIYPLANGRLYAKNSDEEEFELSRPDDPSINHVRLSVSNSDPNPVPGSTGTSVYIHPFEGEQISLYDTVSEKFIPRVVSTPVAFDMTAAGALGGNQVPFMPQDIFLAWDAVNSVFLKKVIPWASAPIQKTVTNITNASPPVLTVGSSHGFAVNDLVVLQDVTGGAASLTNRMFRVTAVASTTVSLGTLDALSIAAPGGTSTNGTLYKITPQTTRGTALTTLRGVKTYFDSGSSNYYKFLGTVAYGEIKETIYDTLDHPFVVSFYNKIMRQIAKVEPDGTTILWNVQSTADTPTDSRAAGNRYQERMWFLADTDAGDVIDVTFLSWQAAPNTANQDSLYLSYLSLDAVANYANNSSSFSRQNSVARHLNPASGSDSYGYTLPVSFRNKVTPGLHFVQAMEFVYNSGTSNWNVRTNLSTGQYHIKGGFEGVLAR